MPPEAVQLLGELVLNIVLLIVITFSLVYGYRYMRRRSAKKARAEQRQAILAEKSNEDQEE